MSSIYTYTELLWLPREEGGGLMVENNTIKTGDSFVSDPTSKQYFQLASLNINNTAAVLMLSSRDRVFPQCLF